jgi:hypothetical protein
MQYFTKNGFVDEVTDITLANEINPLVGEQARMVKDWRDELWANGRPGINGRYVGTENGTVVGKVPYWMAMILSNDPDIAMDPHGVEKWLAKHPEWKVGQS